MPSEFMDFIIGILAIGGFGLAIYIMIKKKNDPDYGLRDVISEIKDAIGGKE